jgi:pimeloyl-ACP methyl ester carboxylesterase
MDNHDSSITDPLAGKREVILFDNRGVASTSGTARETVDDMAGDTGAFISALGLRSIDILGHSMGGEVAQMLALKQPNTIKRLILVGTGPRGGEGMAVPKPSTVELFNRVYEHQDEMWLPIMFGRRKRARPPAAFGSSGFAPGGIVTLRFRRKPHSRTEPPQACGDGRTATDTRISSRSVARRSW